MEIIRRDIDLDVINEYLSANRSHYGSATPSLATLPNDRTLYGNDHGRFIMSDGNSFYVLERNPIEIIESGAIPKNAIEADNPSKLHSDFHILNGTSYYSSKLEALNPLVQQAMEEGLLTEEMLDALGISREQLLYAITLRVFGKQDTLQFTREQIDFYTRILGTPRTDNHSWYAKILYGHSDRADGFVYTKKQIKK